LHHHQRIYYKITLKRRGLSFLRVFHAQVRRIDEGSSKHLITYECLIHLPLEFGHDLLIWGLTMALLEDLASIPYNLVVD